MTLPVIPSAVLAGSTATLRISFHSGRLYALAGGFDILSFNQERLYHTFGTLPETRGR